jgi:GNAT superfamily N-acetyltransferase
VIRAAGFGEADTLVSVYEWLFAPPGAQPARWDADHAVGRLREAIASGASEVLVATDDGSTVVGICTVYLDLDSVRFGQRAWVEDLAVDPERRSAGIGKQLLDAAKDWARSRGATHLELDSAETREAAHRFYEREQPTSRSICYGWEL